MATAGSWWSFTPDVPSQLTPPKELIISRLKGRCDPATRTQPRISTPSKPQQRCRGLDYTDAPMAKPRQDQIQGCFQCFIVCFIVSIGQAWGPVTRKLASGAKTSTCPWSEAAGVVGFPVPSINWGRRWNHWPVQRWHWWEELTKVQHLAIWFGALTHYDTLTPCCLYTSDTLRLRTSEHSAHNSDSDSSGLRSKLRVG